MSTVTPLEALTQEVRASTVEVDSGDTSVIALSVLEEFFRDAENPELDYENNREDPSSLSAPEPSRRTVPG